MISYCEYDSGASLSVRLRDADGHYWDFVFLQWTPTDSAATRVAYQESANGNGTSLYSVDITLPPGGPWIQEAVLDDGEVVAYGDTEIGGELSRIAFLTAPGSTFGVGGLSGSLGDAYLAAVSPQLSLSLARVESGAVTLGARRPTITLAGFRGSVGRIAFAARPPIVTLEGLTGEQGGVALAANAPRVALILLPPTNGGVRLKGGGAAFLVRLRVGTLGGAVLSARVGNLSILGSTGISGSSTLFARRPALTLSGNAGVTGAVALCSGRPQLLLTGISGTAAGFALAARKGRADLAGLAGTLGGIGISRRRPGCSLTLLFPASEIQVWVKNAAAGHSRYQNFPLTAFCRFGDLHLAVGPAGIYELSGDDDAGAPIEASGVTATTDLGVSDPKRLEELYLTVRAEGNLTLGVLVDEERERSYLSPGRGEKAVATRRVRLARGLTGRKVALSFKNVDGGDFELSGIEFTATTLRR